MQSARNEALCSLLTKCPAPDGPWFRMDRRAPMEKRGDRLIGDAELLLTIRAAKLTHLAK